MKKIAWFSALLVLGLVGSQLLPHLGGAEQPAREGVKLVTMLCLSFIMIRVGYEFEIDRSRLRSYAVDYGVAATAAAFPWLFCAAYFVWVLHGPGAGGHREVWQESLLAARFAAPTSAGILFSMLIAAGLAATWLYRKARILAIFDDLDTVLLMIPLKMMMVGFRWQLAVVVGVMALLLWIGWRWMHRLRLPIDWRSTLVYGAGITLVSELVYRASKSIDDVVPIHVEVLLPAFVLGCVIARPSGSTPEESEARAHEQLESGRNGRVATLVSCIFMVAVGLSMPVLLGPTSTLTSSETWPGWGAIALHVVAITALSNLGKMFPLFCYRAEAHWKERLAVCLGMFPRGEVGAGVLVVSMSYGIGETILAVAILSLALNLVLTGLFVGAAKRLVESARADVPALRPAPSS